MQTPVKDVFAIDLRALAAIRITLGLLLLVDFATRLPDLRNFYTDDGILPRTALIEHFPSLLSLHALSGGVTLQAILGALAAASSVMLALGYRTRLATLASFVLFSSLLNRNPMITHGGDLLLRLLLFWLLFLPAGARYSLDARETARLALPLPPSGARERSLASAAFLLQVCLVYWFNALNKHDWIWWDGDAVAYALNIDYITLPLGQWLLNFPSLLRWMTWGVLLLEFGAPILALSPIATTRLRLLIVPLMWGLHVGLDLTMELGLFAYVCLIAWMAFVPAVAWDAIERRLKSRAAQDPSRPMHSPRPHAATQAFVGFVLLYVLAWNIRSLNYARLERFFPSALNVIGETLQVGQSWTMFAPFPATDDGWYVMPAILADGTEVDLFTGDRVTWVKPKNVAATYRNPRWRKYLNNLYEAEHGDHRLYYGRHLCRAWNGSHPPARAVRTFQITYVLERTLSATRIAEPTPIVLWSHACDHSATVSPTPGTTRP